MKRPSNEMKYRFGKMKLRFVLPFRRFVFLLSVWVLCGSGNVVLLAQTNDILSYDECAEAISKSSRKSFDKAFDAYRKGDYSKSVAMLKELSEQEPDFASVSFLLGIIGVVNDKPSMIEKYMTQTAELCPQFSHPLLHYYLGVINYSNENYSKATNDFETFFSLVAQDEYQTLQAEAENYISWCSFLAETSGKCFPFNPEKAENISTSSDETAPFVTHDEKHIYFTRKMAVRQNNDETFYHKSEFKEVQTLCRSDKDENGEYDMGFSVSETMNLPRQTGRVSLTSDNRLLYFSQPVYENSQSSLDIFVCENIDGQWSEAKSVGTEINTAEANETSPCISADGNTLYFISDRQTGIGGYDIYVSHKEKDGTWSKASNMGKRINSPSDELSPFIHPDCHSFYFASNGWKTIGGSDLFYIDLDNIKMKTPRNIGSYINTENDETNIGVLADGKTAYASCYDSVKSNYDICFFPLPDEVCSQSVRLIGGRVNVSASEDHSCSIKLYNMAKRTSVTFNSAYYDGSYVLSLPEKDNHLLKIEKEGYAFYAKILQSSDTNSRIDIELSQLISGEIYPLYDISLDERKHLSQSSLVILDEFVLFLKANPRLRIELSAPEGLANKVADYLQKSGIRQDRIAVSPEPSPSIGYRLQ